MLNVHEPQALKKTLASTTKSLWSQNVCFSGLKSQSPCFSWSICSVWDHEWNFTKRAGFVNLVPWLRKPQRVDCRLSLIVFESVWLWYEAKQWPRKVHKTSNCSLDTKEFKNFLQQFFKLWQGCSSLTRGTEYIKRICRNFSKTSREHRMYLFSINVSLSFCAQSNKQHKLIAVKYTCSILNCSILPFTCKQI